MENPIALVLTSAAVVVCLYLLSSRLKLLTLPVNRAGYILFCLGAIMVVGSYVFLEAEYPSFWRRNFWEYLLFRDHEDMFFARIGFLLVVIGILMAWLYRPVLLRLFRVFSIIFNWIRFGAQ